MSHRRPPKFDPALYVGPHRTFFTMCTFERRKTFTDAAVVEETRQQLLRTAAMYDVEVIAYCFMPDHLHAVISGPTVKADLLKFMAMFRQRSGFAYRHAH
jgi:putative transposase